VWPSSISPSDNKITIKGYWTQCSEFAVYARISTVDKGQDTENHLRELRQFVANQAPEGWTLAGE
jgi:hypothetical protein